MMLGQGMGWKSRELGRGFEYILVIPWTRAESETEKASQATHELHHEAAPSPRCLNRLRGRNQDIPCECASSMG